jgi:ferredoxin-NADP reductase
MTATNMSATNTLRRLVKPLVVPPVFDFWASKLNRLWSWERVLARVVERHIEASDAVTLVLKPNHYFAGFQPGQHVNVSAEIKGTRVTRSYSLTNIPRADGLLSITVKCIEGGKLSQHLCRVAEVGDVLELGAAFGEMVLSSPAPSPLSTPAENKRLFLAAGSGITPLMSLTRALVAQEMPGELMLIYWVRTRAEFCYVRELRALAERYPRFRVHFVLTRETEYLHDELSGRISAELLQKLVPDLRQYHVYSCGPAGFVAAARELAGSQAKNFQSEAFTPLTFNIQATGTVRVELTASQRVLEIPVGQSLLSALEAEGVNPAYGCRIGICNTCACGKRAGTTQNLNSGEQSSEPTSALRLCVSRACTDLTLDL